MHWIHSANRRAGEWRRPLGAQHLARCPSTRLISPSLAQPPSACSAYSDGARARSSPVPSPSPPAHRTHRQWSNSEGGQRRQENRWRWIQASCNIWGILSPDTLAGSHREDRQRGRTERGQADGASNMTQPEAKRNHPSDGWSSQDARPRRSQAGQVRSTLVTATTGRPSRPLPLFVGCPALPFNRISRHTPSRLSNKRLPNTTAQPEEPPTPRP
jgi:hypothetical protein